MEERKREKQGSSGWTSQDYIFPCVWWQLKNLSIPRKRNIHLYSNPTPIKIIPVLDFHWKPQVMNQKPWVQTLLLASNHTRSKTALSSSILWGVNWHREGKLSGHTPPPHLALLPGSALLSPSLYSTARRPWQWRGPQLFSFLLAHVSRMPFHIAQEIWPLLASPIHSVVGTVLFEHMG